MTVETSQSCEHGIDKSSRCAECEVNKTRLYVDLEANRLKDKKDFFQRAMLAGHTIDKAERMWKKLEDAGYA